MSEEPTQDTSKQYDKILRENIGEFILSLSSKYLGIEVVKSEELKDKLETTLEREADFLRFIYDAKNQKSILHLEFQTQNEKEMILRMQEYFAILKKKHKLPVHQFVIYLGNEKVNMRTQLQDDEIFRGFTLLDLKSISYTQFINSDIPEEIVLAILCNFEQEEVGAVLTKIIQSLQRTSKDPITLEKYIRQILVFSRLRDLAILTKKQLKDMALIFDIEKDPFYKEGIEVGIEKGIEKGVEIGVEKEALRKNTEGVKKALLRGKLTSEEIAEDFEVSLDFVLEIKKKLGL